MRGIRYSSESDRPQVIHDDGTVSDAQSIPFYQYSFLRLRWLPICIKHKLVFKNDEAYSEHWTPVCENFDHRDCPRSDYLFKLRGYHNAP